MKNALALMHRTMTDPLLARLTTDDRRKVNMWQDILARMDAATDKAFEVVCIQNEYRGTLRGLSSTAIYARMKAFERNGLAGIAGKVAVRRAQAVMKGEAPGALPRAFVVWWQGLCGCHQRGKILSVWRHVIRNHLMAGKVIPGYGCDWRGIWLAEHEGFMCPERCPYKDDHRAGLHPRGWGYDTLAANAPRRDIWLGATQGVQAMRFAGVPSVPHTRVGLQPMRVITMDDVDHDHFVTFPGQREPQRPVELGAIDIYTGNFIGWALLPVRQRPDGSRIKIDALQIRYLQAHFCCGIGLHPRGTIQLLERGTAGMKDDEVARINKILGKRPDGGEWLTVLRSATTGAPLVKGLFAESGRGSPRHKSPLESLWNLLHNETALLPAQTGKDWDHAPQDTVGWQREDKALIRLAEDLVRECPDAVRELGDPMRRLQSHALTYYRFRELLNVMKLTINNRRGHSLTDWEKCGFVKQVAMLPGGVEYPINDADPASAKLAAALVEGGTKFRSARMSPMEAWRASAPGAGLVKFHPHFATRILGEELAQGATVGESGKFFVRDPFSGERLEYWCDVRTDDAATRILERGMKLMVWVNPFAPGPALVCNERGQWLGVAERIVPTVYGATDDHTNLGRRQRFVAEQNAKVSVAAAGRVGRERDRRRANAGVVAGYLDAQGDLSAEAEDDANALVEAAAAEYDGGDNFEG